MAKNETARLGRGGDAAWVWGSWGLVVFGPVQSYVGEGMAALGLFWGSFWTEVSRILLLGGGLG